MGTKLILIRHGETEYSIERRYCGFTDVPLNQNGRLQSVSLRSKLSEFQIDLIYSSDLKRAYQTAEIVFPEKDIIQDLDLREVNFGLWEGLTHKEIVARYDKLYSQWLKEITMFPTPQGESLIELNLRVMQAFNNIINKHTGRTIAIIGHGGPFSIIRCHITNKGLDKFWDLIPSIASLTEICCNEKLYYP